MPIFAKQAVLVAKVQTTAGTYLEPAVTDWVEATDLTLTPFEADTTELSLIRKTFGASQQFVSGLRVKLSFSIALAGSGTAGTAPYWGALERICGMAQTIVAATSVAYAPADTNFEIGSLACYIGVNKHAMRDARGTSTLDVTKSGFLVRKYEITGIYVDPVVGVIPAVAIAPRIMPDTLQSGNTTMTMFGATPCVQAMSIDTGFDVKYMKFLGNCTDTISINDRSCKGSIEIVAESIAVKDWFSLVKLGTTGTIAFAINPAGTAGKKLTINAPKVQLLNPQYGDVDGIKTLKMDMVLMPSAGSDDYSIINA